MAQDLKAPARICRGCGTDIPEQVSSPGRPREFCTRQCRRDFYHRQEQAEIESERRAREEARRFEMDVHFHGIREAKKRAKLRAEAGSARRSKP